MTVTSTTAKLVGTPEMLGAKHGAVTATVPKTEIEEALQSDAPLELILDVLRTEEGATEVEAREVGVAWEREDLESLLGETPGDWITFSFDRDELEQVLGDDFEGHGLRERVLVLTVAAAAASAVASNASAMPYADPGSGAAIVQTATPSAHDEATLAERGIQAEPAATTHDEATLAARGIEPEPTAATHDEATAAARGIGVAPVIGTAHDEATLATRGIEPQSVPATHDEATLVERGIEPAVTPSDSGFELPSFDAGTTAVVGGLAGAGLVIAAAGFAARRRRDLGTA